MEKEKNLEDLRSTLTLHEMIGMDDFDPKKARALLDAYDTAEDLGLRLGRLAGLATLCADGAECDNNPDVLAGAFTVFHDDLVQLQASAEWICHKLKEAGTREAAKYVLDNDDMAQDAL